MAHINLLPWRAERRKQREREFYGQLVVAGVVALVVLIAWIFFMGQRIDNQQSRNQYLKDQIRQVDVKIHKIKDLEKTRSQLLARKEIVEHLQSSRSQMVHLFDAMVKTIPASVRLTSMTQKGQHLTLDGVAQSNASVAEYMRHLEGSPWLGKSDLEKTVNHHDGSQTPYSFGLGLDLNLPTDEEIAAAQEKAKGKDKDDAPASASSSAGGKAVAASVAGKPDGTASKGGKA